MLACIMVKNREIYSVNSSIRKGSQLPVSFECIIAASRRNDTIEYHAKLLLISSCKCGPSSVIHIIATKFDFRAVI